MADLINAIGQSNNLGDFLSEHAGYGMQLINTAASDGMFILTLSGTTTTSITWASEPVILVPSNTKFAWIAINNTGYWFMRDGMVCSGNGYNVFCTNAKNGSWGKTTKISRFDTEIRMTLPSTTDGFVGGSWDAIQSVPRQEYQFRLAAIFYTISGL